MKIIVPCNNKGGVGKTCISTILAEYFSKVLNKKTLIIDLDPQCNISQRTIQMEIDPNHKDGHMPCVHPDYKDNESLWERMGEMRGRSSIADIFLRPEYGTVPYPTNNENLDIMPAHASDLLLVERCLKEEVLEKIYNRFNIFLQCRDVQEEYEYVVVDTAPSKGPLTRSAMRAATDIIIPTQMEDKPIRGVFGMMQLWMSEKKLRPQDNPLNLIGVLPNMFDARTALHTGMYESLRNDEMISPYLMPCKLSRRITYAENDTENAMPKSIFDMPNSNKAKAECIAMCEYVYDKISSNNMLQHKELV